MGILLGILTINNNLLLKFPKYVPQTLLRYMLTGPVLQLIEGNDEYIMIRNGSIHCYQHVTVVLFEHAITILLQHLANIFVHNSRQTFTFP